jgi:formate dehydrogenase major subunit
VSGTLTRRQLLQTGAAATATTFGFDLRPAAAAARQLKIERTSQTRSVCPYCAVGCSVVLHTLGDRADNVEPALVHVEGDPGSPINGGTLCPKGISLKQFVVNDRRLTRPLVREPGAAEWAEISWDEALERMARRIKQSRDTGFEAVDGLGRTVNRLTSVGLIGGCTDTNEINYLLGKMRFGLGILPYENQARL